MPRGALRTLDAEVVEGKFERESGMHLVPDPDKPFALTDFIDAVDREPVAPLALAMIREYNNNIDSLLN